ncbi:MAG: cyclic pyranopterin monophosphate synthase MoaC [Candidatus Omnitrophica bacterium]|nr:cyclic pyranopterin monophosphate synthase MoaC [Candidatus Omnitrophota bacterium]
MKKKLETGDGSPVSLSHLDSKGELKMVDVGSKKDTERTAIARGEVRMSPEAFRQLKENRLVKGDAVAVAKTAGILAAKRTAGLIPLCHSLPLDSIDLRFIFLDDGRTVEIESTVKTSAKTGVEMEALTAVAVAGLTLYDMCKAVDKGIVIGNIRLIKKTGGKSGAYLREGEEKIL